MERCNALARVVLTREQGKNDKMMSALGKLGIECLEMPLIIHEDGPDRWVPCSPRGWTHVYM